ncbi:MAG: phosphatase [Desulfobacteraceae bacterium 4572_89]|nr:MAG: phosphatase [Desulfobacteraceae bacterium 4572_89]
MRIVKGDLIQKALAGEFDIILHGCNCFCAMGAGIAKQIRDKFPSAYQADLETEKGDKKKLGNYSKAKIQKNNKTFIIINGYIQYHYSGPGVLADYNAIDALFFKIQKKFSGKKIGYPKIGAGLARGDWEKISSIIDHRLEGENHTLVEYCGLQK